MDLKVWRFFYESYVPQLLVRVALNSAWPLIVHGLLGGLRMTGKAEVDNRLLMTQTQKMMSSINFFDDGRYNNNFEKIIYFH